MNNKFVYIDSYEYKTFRDSFNTDFESQFSEIDKILENSYGLQYFNSESNSFIYKVIDDSKFALFMIQYSETITKIISYE